MAKELKVKLTFIEPVLGSSPADEEVYRTFIASKAPNATSLEDEIAAIGVDGVVEKGMTIFPKLDDGTPFVWDYQIKGFFKDACGVLRKIPSNKSSKIKAFKKEIDGLIFINERRSPFVFEGDTGVCQRSLRAQTMQGERTALAISEEVPAGATLEFTINMLSDDHEAAVREWLDYGKLRGLGQWRNSGKGRFVWEEVD